MSPNKTEEGSGDEKLLGQGGVDVSWVDFLKRPSSLVWKIAALKRARSEDSPLCEHCPLPSPSLLLLDEKLPRSD